LPLLGAGCRGGVFERAEQVEPPGERTERSVGQPDDTFGVRTAGRPDPDERDLDGQRTNHTTIEPDHGPATNGDPPTTGGRAPYDA
jgi:hypothetical protein